VQQTGLRSLHHNRNHWNKKEDDRTSPVVSVACPILAQQLKSIIYPAGDESPAGFTTLLDAAKSAAVIIIFLFIVIIVMYIYRTLLSPCKPWLNTRH